MTQSPTANPFNNPASKEERSRILKEQARVIAEQEERSAGTRAAYNNIVDPMPSGRWSKPSRGNDPSKLYPTLPASSPWHHDPVPNEEPFGIDVNAVEAVGTHEEIERSLSATAPPAAVVPSSPDRQQLPADGPQTSQPSANLAASPPATSAPSPDVAESARPSSSHKWQRRKFT
jgi:hypothetical protein